MSEPSPRRILCAIFEPGLAVHRTLRAGMVVAARAAGSHYVMLVTDRENSGTDQNRGNLILPACDAVHADMADGYIANEPCSNVLRLCREAAAHGRPNVQVNWGEPELGPVIEPDNVAAAQEAVRHLHELGHRRIAYIHGHPGNPHAEERLEGYRRGLAEHNLPWDDRLVAVGRFVTPGGHSAMDELLARGAEFTAVIAANDYSALGALRRIHEAGLRVPEDIALVGWDDLPGTRTADPPLTTFNHALYERGRTAIDLLLQQLESGQRDQGEKRTPMRLMIRASTVGHARAEQEAASAPPPPPNPPLDARSLTGDVTARLLERCDAWMRSSPGQYIRNHLEAYLRAAVPEGAAPTERTTVERAILSTLNLVAEALPRSEVLDEAHVLPARAYIQQQIYARITAPAPVNETVARVTGVLDHLAVSHYSVWLRPELFGERGGFVAHHGFACPKPRTLERTFLRDLLQHEKEPMSLCLAPLILDDQFLGLIILTADHPTAALWNEVVAHVRSALHSALLFEQLTASNRELSRARAAAEAASRAKSEFLAVMSHEIRTPMTGVLGMASLLHETALDGQQQDFVRTIEHSGEALLAIINDLLDFSKIEAGRVELEQQPFSPRVVVEDVADLFAARAAPRQVALIVEVGEDVPGTIVGDALRFRQIVANLVSNAVKFTEHGEVHLTLLVSSGPNLLHGDSSPRLVLTVRDTGIGMSKSQQALLFQSFHQGDASISRRFGGSGLGLAISKRLVELMNGDVRVESEPGVGSTFRCTIPILHGTAPTALPVIHLPAGTPVLVADGNASQQRVLAEQLRRAQLTVHEAEGADAVLQFLEQQSTSAVLLLDASLTTKGGEFLVDLLGNQPKLLRNSAVLLLLPATGTPTRYANWPYLRKPVREARLREALAGLGRGGMDTAGFYTRAVRREQTNEPAKIADLRILLVEDNEVNKHVTSAMLQQCGFKPDVASDGFTALQAATAQDYHLILMDISMPGMDGCECTRRIRAAGRPWRPQILALTAGALAADHARCMDAGMDGVLTKPMVLSELRRVLREVATHWSQRTVGS